MSTHKEREEKLKMIMGWIENCPSLNVSDKGLVSISIEDAHNSPDYIELMEHADDIMTASKNRQ